MFTVGRKQIGESVKYGQTKIKFDQFSGEVLQVQDAFKPTRAERVLNSFIPLHYGSFGGLPTRILYVFVGLAPLVLFISGAKMFKLRFWDRKRKQLVRDLSIPNSPSAIEHHSGEL